MVSAARALLSRRRGDRVDAVTWVSRPQLVAARWVGRGRENQSCVNILDAITSCWTLPNTFMEALGKVFLYQPPTPGPLGQWRVIFTCSCWEGIGKRAEGEELDVYVLITFRMQRVYWFYLLNVTLCFVLS